MKYILIAAALLVLSGALTRQASAQMGCGDLTALVEQEMQDENVQIMEIVAGNAATAFMEAVNADPPVTEYPTKGVQITVLEIEQQPNLQVLLSVGNCALMRGFMSRDQYKKFRKGPKGGV